MGTSITAPAMGSAHPPASAIDPVCEMTVDPATAYSAAVGGEMYYFCAEYCRDLFVSRPEAFGAAGRSRRPRRDVTGVTLGLGYRDRRLLRGGVDQSGDPAGPRGVRLPGQEAHEIGDRAHQRRGKDDGGVLVDGDLHQSLQVA